MVHLSGLSGRFSGRKRNMTMLCEVCERPAVDRTPPGYDGVKISCPTCGNYSLAGSVKKTFRQLSPDNRRRALEKAKAHASLGMRPLISAIEL
jgi:hypothetical protein